MNNKRSAPTAGGNSNDRSGHVRFDDRGNAVWETRTGQQLEHPTLDLADEQAPRNTRKTNGGGLRTGYDPYDSGMLPKSSYRRRKDLRALSKWIEAMQSPGKRARD